MIYNNNIDSLPDKWQTEFCFYFSNKIVLWRYIMIFLKNKKTILYELVLRIKHLQYPEQVAIVHRRQLLLNLQPRSSQRNRVNGGTLMTANS